MSTHIAQSLWQQRMAAGWIGAFSLLALLLAAVGLYGIVSQTVALRTWEMGVRMALGAAPGSVARLIVRDGMLLAAAGLAIGFPVALACRRATRGLVPGMTGAAPLSFAAMALLLVLVMLAACWLPARRAARVNPLEALRSE